MNGVHVFSDKEYRAAMRDSESGKPTLSALAFDLTTWLR